MGVTRYKAYPYRTGVQYSKYDFINGVYSGQENTFYYATRDCVNEHPLITSNYSVTSWQVVDNKATVFFQQTGTLPLLNIGSLIQVTGLSETYMDYTGIATDAGNGYVSFPISTWSTGSSTASGIIRTQLNPAWTTGWFFLPSYSTNLDIETRVIETKLGDGYTQTQRDGLNASQSSWNLSFENRSNKETLALLNFVCDKGGVDNFRITFPIGALENDPTQKYKALNPKVSTVGYNLNTVSLTVKQSFDL